MVAAQTFGRSFDGTRRSTAVAGIATGDDAAQCAMPHARRRHAYADVYRPAGEGPFPVILMRLPYDKTQAENITYSHPSWYAQRGYMVVVQDVRGYWASEGEFTPFLHEAEDGYDTIEWAARLPGANGRVGMYGFSYAGATQLLPATLRPPSLVTVCPALTASQYYEGWTYNQGALALAFAMSWAVNLAEMEARRAKDDEAMASLRAAFANSQGWNWYLPLTEFPPLTGKYGGYFFDWLAHPTYDDYWRRWSIDEDYGRLDHCPRCTSQAGTTSSSPARSRISRGMRTNGGSDAARAGQKLIVGPWTHMPWAPASVTDEGADRASSTICRLAGSISSSRVRRPACSTRPFRSLSWEPRSGATIPIGHRRDLSRCGGSSIPEAGPTRASATVRCRLDAPGDEPPISSPRTAGCRAPSIGGHSCCLNFVAPMGPADQRPAEEFNGVLVYTSEPLRKRWS